MTSAPLEYTCKLPLLPAGLKHLWYKHTDRDVIPEQYHEQTWCLFVNAPRGGVAEDQSAVRLKHV